MQIVCNFWGVLSSRWQKVSDVQIVLPQQLKLGRGEHRNKCADGEKDTIDYSYDCDAYHKNLFEATVTKSRRSYDCTSCTMTFQTKYGWSRYETTIYR